jgi:voltage-gated potassium channel Kch
VGTTSTGAIGLRLAAVVAAVLATVLGAVGFVEFLPNRPEFAAATAWDIAYYTMQLFVLDPAPLDVPQPYPVPLEIARFLAPATTIFAVIETVRVLLWERVRRWSVAHASNHVVIAGNDPVALLLARRFAADGERVALISDVVDEPLVRQRDVFVVPGDPTQEATLRAAGAHRASTLYACGRESGTNLIIALTARRVVVRPVTVQAEMRDVALFTTLRTARTAGGEAGTGPDPGSGPEIGFWLNFFVVDDLAARTLLSRESLAEGYDDADPVVVLGNTPFGEAMVRQLARRQATTRHGPVMLVPEASAAAWTPTDGTPGPRLYVCLTDPEQALHTAFTHARNGCRRVVLCLPQQSAIQDALSGALLDDADGRLAVFGILDAACDAVPRDHLDELGRALHEHYVRVCRAQGDTVATNPSLVPWARLPHHLKQSNRAQADHLGTKLATIGCAIVPAVRGAEPFAFREGEIARLAELEHQRWMAERRAVGFVYGPVREGRFHPDLVDWQDLDQRTRDKDIQFVKYIPDLLEGAGFQILRL